MAAAFNKLAIRTRPSICSQSWHRIYRPTRYISPNRSFTYSSRLRAKDDDYDEDREDREEAPAPIAPVIPLTELSESEFVNTLDPADQAIYRSLSPEDKKAVQGEAESLRLHMSSPSVKSRLDSLKANAAYELETKYPEVNSPIPIKEDLMNMMDMEDPDIGEEPEFDQDDITSLAHAELEQHRELREYARIAAWEMPLLSKLAKPFVLPARDQPLRFRYTTYLGEQHPAEKKVVLEFCTKDLPNLTEVQRSKLIKLVGVRYNPDTDVVKMSCEMFETQAQNKRYLGDVVDLLLKEARDPTDTFEDIPMDFRHHKSIEKPKFPKHWYMTPDRERQLENARAERRQIDQQKKEQGKLIDGAKEIQRVFATTSVRASLPNVQARSKEITGGRKSRLKAR